MDYLYSLYDALVSIHVPNDKARAVVDAMERDMGTTLATKADLEIQRVATKGDLEILRLSIKGDLENLRLSTKADVESLRSDLESFRASVNSEFRLLRVEMSAMSKDITVRLGSTMLALIMLLFAALKLT
ncbi:MAG: hypothetical protein ABI567_08415 [Gammaproteobacteria bacterium]